MVDIYSIISLIVAGTVGIGTIWVAYQIAKKSGQFKKVELDIALMNQSTIKDPPLYEIIYGYIGNSYDIAYCYLPFDLINKGETTMKNINFTIVYSFNLTPGLDDKNLKYEVELGDDSLVKRKSKKIDNVWIVNYIISQLNPKQRIRCCELINIVQASSFPLKVDGTTKDGVPIQATIELNYTSSIKFKLSIADVEPLYGQFYIRTCFVKNWKELKEKITEKETRILRNELIKIKAPKKFVEKHVYVPYIYGKAIVSMPEFKKIAEGEYNGEKTIVYQEEYKKSTRRLIKPK